MEVTTGETRHIILTDAELKLALDEFITARYSEDTEVKNLSGFRLTGVKRMEGTKYHEGTPAGKGLMFAQEPSTAFRFVSLGEGR
jgi:hypothetical protein